MHSCDVFCISQLISGREHPRPVPCRNDRINSGEARSPRGGSVDVRSDIGNCVVTFFLSFQTCITAMQFAHAGNTSHYRPKQCRAWRSGIRVRRRCLRSRLISSACGLLMIALADAECLFTVKRYEWTSERTRSQLVVKLRT